MTNDKLTNRILPVKMLLLDVDGVLTRGNIVYTEQAEEIKMFSVKDGLGIRLLMDAGIKVGIITGRQSKALQARCSNLGITMVYDGVRDKEETLPQVMHSTGLTLTQIAFAGDDLPDIRIMKQVGFAVAVADACEDVRDIATYTTTAPGGEGAVREISELILKTQGLWEQVIARFL